MLYAVHWAGRRLNLRDCCRLFECQPERGSESALQAVFKQEPFDPQAWLRVVFPWAAWLEKSGVEIEPPRPLKLGREEASEVDDKLAMLLSQARSGAAARKRRIAQNLDALGVLSSDANHARASAACRSEMRKKVSLEEMRLHAQHLVLIQSGHRVQGKASAGLKHAATPQDPIPMVEVATKLEELDAQLFQNVRRLPAAIVAARVEVTVPKAPVLPRRGSKMARSLSIVGDAAQGSAPAPAPAPGPTTGSISARRRSSTSGAQSLSARPHASSDRVSNVMDAGSMSARRATTGLEAAPAAPAMGSLGVRRVSSSLVAGSTAALLHCTVSGSTNMRRRSDTVDFMQTTADNQPSTTAETYASAASTAAPGWSRRVRKPRKLLNLPISPGAYLPSRPPTGLIIDS